MLKDNNGEPTVSCRARLVSHCEHMDAVFYVEEHRVGVLSLQVHFAAGCVLIGRYVQSLVLLYCEISSFRLQI